MAATVKQIAKFTVGRRMNLNVLSGTAILDTSQLYGQLSTADIADHHIWKTSHKIIFATLRLIYS